MEKKQPTVKKSCCRNVDESERDMVVESFKVVIPERKLWQ